jgi:hypothetical protein
MRLAFVESENICESWHVVGDKSAFEKFLHAHKPSSVLIDLDLIEKDSVVLLLAGWMPKSLVFVGSLSCDRRIRALYQAFKGTSYFPKPLSDQDREEIDALSNQGKVFQIQKSGGGTGGTLMAALLGHGFVNQGRHSVLLIDGDAVTHGLTRGYDEAIKPVGDLDYGQLDPSFLAQICRWLPVGKKSPLSFGGTPLGLLTHKPETTEAWSVLLSLLRGYFDVVIIDGVANDIPNTDKIWVARPSVSGLKTIGKEKSAWFMNKPLPYGVPSIFYPKGYDWVCIPHRKAYFLRQEAGQLASLKPPRSIKKWCQGAL